MCVDIYLYMCVIIDYYYFGYFLCELVFYSGGCIVFYENVERWFGF